MVLRFYSVFVSWWLIYIIRDTMTYDPTIPQQFYDNLADKEWNRLTKDRLGELLYHVHMDVLQQRISPDHAVLELGAGAGIFTKELVHMAERLVVSDLSAIQLDLNRKHMQELGCHDRIEAFLQLDLTDLSTVEPASFDAVVCIGGPLSYLLNKERDGIREMLNVVKPGGLLILGVMSLVSTVIRNMEGLKKEKDSFGLDAMRHVLETGVQDPDHYPGPQHAKHYVHMMRSHELDALFADESATVVEKRAAGLLALAGEDTLNRLAEDEALWRLMLEMELAYSKLQGAVDLGANMLYVVRRD